MSVDGVLLEQYVVKAFCYFKTSTFEKRLKEANIGHGYTQNNHHIDFYILTTRKRTRRKEKKFENTKWETFKKGAFWKTKDTIIFPKQWRKGVILA